MLYSRVTVILLLVIVLGGHMKFGRCEEEVEDSTPQFLDSSDAPSAPIEPLSFDNAALPAAPPTSPRQAPFPLATKASSVLSAFAPAPEHPSLDSDTAIDITAPQEKLNHALSSNSLAMPIDTPLVPEILDAMKGVGYRYEWSGDTGHQHEFRATSNVTREKIVTVDSDTSSTNITFVTLATTESVFTTACTFTKTVTTATNFVRSSTTIYTPHNGSNPETSSDVCSWSESNTENIMLSPAPDDCPSHNAGVPFQRSDEL
ncbi:hypothetical protein BOTBODRAFT_169093 [Botryobasidium botryosum FD-172 SS1]|uniref:Uncharacterized protein n=1 Tax=Botryobasidium botryosum (strain FD-172 SS1) TaxID=930990 RepID=A0A067N247_BOTB1|nr:hypothetical protein BOTBODRAFT_169093 [Botryobasidium botryosum FD-172 SS1]